MTNTEDDAILVRTEGQAGRITLNRPGTLNALTLEMVRLYDAALTRFEQMPSIETVIVDGAGDRGLCAGGNIRSLYEAVLSGDDLPRIFWAEQYRLNARIARYPKPVVAIMDGIVMGGGIGISAHASHRVVTEHSALAMPEVGIGFFPDVGARWLLSRAPGETGTHVALTGERLGGADAILCGLADHFVLRDRIESLLTDLTMTDIESALGPVESDPGEGRLAAQRQWIDPCYSASSVEEIVARLQGDGGDAELTAREILSKSPTALKVTLHAMRQVPEFSSLEDCLISEYRVATSFLDVHDYVEGVRAAIIDKDRSPRWSPSTLEEVHGVAHYFAPRADELKFKI